MDEKNNEKLLDQSSEIVEIGNESIMDQSMSNSILDVSHSSGIRSSRRRLKGSAVVMNTDRLQKYIHKEAVEESSDDPFRAQMLGFKEKYKQKMTLKLAADAKMDSFRRKVSTKILVRWWKSYLLNRGLKFCQDGVWSFHVAHRVFAVLLGFRVRKLMRSTKVIQNISGQKDIQNVLTEMHSSMLGDSADLTDRTVPKWEIFRHELDTHTIDDLLLKYSSAKLSDVTLAKSMCKQLFVERHNLSKLILGGAVWRQYPPPGFWDISAALHRAFVAAHEKENRSAINSSSPARRIPSQKGNMETPPNVRRAVKNSSANSKALSGDAHMRNKNNSHLITGSEEYFAPGGGVSGDHNFMSSEDGAVNRLRHSNERQERVIEPQLLRTPENNNRKGFEGVRVSEQISGGTSSMLGSGGGKPIRRPDTAPCSGTGASLAANSTPVGGNSINSNNVHSSGVSPQVQRQRASQRGHIQLQILSAERLMPARKGAPLRDSAGGAVADRIPCLKVKLMLPNWSAGSTSRAQSSPDVPSSTMKRVFEQTKDYTIVTLNPQWDATFILNLPCPRNVVQSLAANEAASAYNSEQSGELSDRAYDIITRALLQWWSLGTINIEVFDGERFNQDIFMGYIDLILNGFMVLIKKPNDLEIKGNFQLNKQKPTDRISGSVKLHAFLHVPEKAYIAELLEPTSSKRFQPNLPPNSQSQSQSQSNAYVGKVPVIATSRVTDGNSSSDIDESDPSQRHSTPPPYTNSNTRKSASGAVYSSKFMQSLARQALQSSSPEDRQDGLDSTRAGNTSSPPELQPHFLGEPQLDETENIRFNTHSGQAVSQQNISASARLLKEKLRKSKTVRKPAGVSATPPALPEDELYQDNNVHISHSASGIERLPMRNTSASVSMGLRDSSTGGAAKAQKEQSVDSSHVRRRSMEDINLRLAGLTAVQHSTEVVLDNLNFKLEAKLRSKEESSFIESRMPTDQEMSAALDNSQSEKSFDAISKRDMEEVRRLMAMAELEEPEEETASEEDRNESNAGERGLGFEYEEAVASPAAARRLHSSYSSHEDEDAPEMGGMSEEEEEEYGVEDEDVDDEEDSAAFQDAYEDEEEHTIREKPSEVRSRPAPPPPPPPRETSNISTPISNMHSREAYAQSRAAEEEEQDEQWDYQSDSETYPVKHNNQNYDDDVDVPVRTAKRAFVNLGVPRPPPSFVPPPPPTPPPLSFPLPRDSQQQQQQHSRLSPHGMQKTIFASENDDDYNDNDGGCDEFAEGGYSGKVNHSTVSSVYSNDIMDFLSPEKIRPQQSRHGVTADDDDDNDNDGVDGVRSDEETEEEDADELIVVGGGSSSKDSSLNSHRSIGSSKPFEVQSYFQVSPSSPSRSLIDTEGINYPPPPLGESAYQSPQRSQRSGRDRLTVMSPGSGDVHRVALELDDLEL